MTNKKPLCAVPWSEVYHKTEGRFENCCSTDPKSLSQVGQSVESWWHGKEMMAFRTSLTGDSLPNACHRCTLSELATGKSLRTETNKQVNLKSLKVEYPSRWNLSFGNTCNLGCFICDEASSTVIENHKRKLQMLPIGFVSPRETFKKQWPSLYKSVLKSYDYHDIVNIRVLGGEPLYNKDVLSFLQNLIDLKLSNRTKLEFDTNATTHNKQIQKILGDYKIYNTWKHISMHCSLDAIGKKAEWLRWGTKWDIIERNIEQFKRYGMYLEVHCTTSILSVMDLPMLKKWCETRNLPLRIGTVSHPDFLSLQNWPGDKDLLCDRHEMEQAGLLEYYNLIGSDKDTETPMKLKSYLNRLSSMRESLRLYDKKLAEVFDVD